MPPLPRLSSSIVLLRVAPNNQPGFQVLLTKRTAKLRSFSELFVFPGGVHEEFDAVFGAHVASCKGVDAAKAHLKLTGLRELFEETGILLAASGPDSQKEVSCRSIRMENKALKMWQGKVHAHAAAFEALVEEHVESQGLQLPLHSLCDWVTFLTPQVEKRRFNCNFFLAFLDPAASDSVQIALDGVETDLYEWLDPSEALRRNRSKTMGFLPPQFYVLRTLCGFSSLQKLQRFAVGGKRKVPPAIEPLVLGKVSEDSRIEMAYPGDPDHHLLPGGVAHRQHRIRWLKDGGYSYKHTLAEDQLGYDELMVTKKDSNL